MGEAEPLRPRILRSLRHSLRSRIGTRHCSLRLNRTVAKCFGDVRHPAAFPDALRSRMARIASSFTPARNFGSDVSLRNGETRQLLPRVSEGEERELYSLCKRTISTLTTMCVTLTATLSNFVTGATAGKGKIDRK